MPKVAPPRPPLPPATAMITLRRQSRRLDLTSIEHRIIDHILWEGRDLRWTMFIGTNLAAEIGYGINKGTVVTKHGLTKLSNRKWIKRGINEFGQTYAQFTPTFVKICALAQQRYEVRRAVGRATWQKLNGSDKIADTLHELAADMPHARYRDRVRAAARAFIAGIGSQQTSGLESHPRRVGKQPSQGGIPTLSLIEGERKSGA